MARPEERGSPRGGVRVRSGGASGWLLLGAASFAAGVLGPVLFRSDFFRAGPFGTGPFGAGPFGAGPFGAGPFGAGPMGAGQSGAGQSDAGPLRSESGAGASGQGRPAAASVRSTPASREAAESRFQRGYELLESERFAAALEEFEQAARLDPSDPRPHHGLGLIYRKMLLEEPCERSLRRAIAIDPGFRESQRELSKLLYDAGRHDEAIALLEAMRRAEPRDAFVWAELAINFLRQGRAAEAASLLEKYNAAAARPAWGLAHLGRARALAGDEGGAEAAYREALAIDPSLAIAHYWLGLLLVATGRAAEAEKPLAAHQRLQSLASDRHALEMALLRDPDDLESLLGLTRVRFLLGKSEDALRCFERASKLAPDDPRVRAIRSQLDRRRSASSRAEGPLDARDPATP